MDSNPYDPPSASLGDKTHGRFVPGVFPRRYKALAGGILSILFTFPTAAFAVMFFRFPIPFVGFRSGTDHLAGAMMGVLFYGLFGLFPIAGVAGAIGGFALGTIMRRQHRGTIVVTLLCSLLATAVVVFSLAYFGPWWLPP